MRVYHEDVGDVLDIESVTVAVYGLGKMGLPLAAVLADAGATVRGVDIDPDVVTAVNAGETPVTNEPGLPELIESHAGGRLKATTDGVAAAEAADVMIILVPTIVDDDNEPILDPIVDVGESISAGASDGDLVILESTVPPGTTEEVLVDAVESDGFTAGEDFGVAYCPERTYAGNVIRDLTESYPKIVGGIDGASTASAAALYRVFNEPGVIEVGSTKGAEAVKVFEGVFRDVNIALANELAKVCEQWILDSESVFRAANTQPFCNIHTPGIGVGGHCIPVYPHFVTQQADDTPLIETAREVNDSMPDHALTILQSLLGGQDRTLPDSRVLVLGVTYRPGVHETRYAPAVDAIGGLLERGATVYAHDPLLDDDELESFGAIPVDSPLDVTDLDGVVLATGHKDYEAIDLSALFDSMRTPVFVDGRRFFDAEEMSAFTYATIGDGTGDYLP